MSAELLRHQASMKREIAGDLRLVASMLTILEDRKWLF